MLEDAALSVVSDKYISLEDLDRISDTIDKWKYVINGRLTDAVRSAVKRQFETAQSAFNDIDSESTVDEHADTLQKLGRQVGLSDEVIKDAYYLAIDRKNEIAAEVEDASAIAARTPPQPSADAIDEAALQNLFAPLLRMT